MPNPFIDIPITWSDEHEMPGQLDNESLQTAGEGFPFMQLQEGTLDEISVAATKSQRKISTLLFNELRIHNKTYKVLNSFCKTDEFDCIIGCF